MTFEQSEIARLTTENKQLKKDLKTRANEIGQLRKEVKDLRQANTDLAEDVWKYRSLE